MYSVIGSTGHIGTNVLKTLEKNNKDVLAITHSIFHAAKLKLSGTPTAIADIHNPDDMALHLSKAECAFILNPPGDISKDSDKIEKETAAQLIEAIKKSECPRIVAASTQGAQPGERIGDFAPLYELEEGLKKLNKATRITRGAYYFTNWDMQAETVKKTGVLKSFYPLDFVLPIVDPKDLGVFNAKLMMENFDGFEINQFSGPEDYTVVDVAKAFEKVFNREVKVEVVPEAQWFQAFKEMGFSDSSAESFVNMTRMTVNKQHNPVGQIFRGTTTLQEYFEEKYQ